MESGNLLEQPEEGPPILGAFPRFADKNSLSRFAGTGPIRPRLSWYAAIWDRPSGAVPFFAGKAAYL